MLATPWEGDPIAGHGVPRTDRQNLAIFILADPIIQDRGVVDEGVEFPVGVRVLGGWCVVASTLS